MVGNFVLRRQDSGAVKRNLQPENRRFTSPIDILDHCPPFECYFFTFSYFEV